MIYRLFITDAAQADVHEITQWYESQQFGLGDRFGEAVLRTIRLIHERPSMYPVHSYDTRRALVKDFPYIVLYRTLGDIVSILAVFHGHRHDTRWRS